jgi:hypothetical protein
MAGLQKSREEILKKGQELAAEYERKYGGCCQTTLLAAADALRTAGLDIFPEDMQDKLYSGICLLSAGGGLTGEGTCGAVSGSIIAIGMALGVPSDSPEPMEKAAGVVQETILAKFFDKYRSILCKDVMRKYFGKAWDLQNEEATKEFLGITDGCAIDETVAMTIETILDEIEKGNIKV